jgi:hypothetical protein
MPTPPLTFLSYTGEQEAVTSMNSNLDVLTITVAGPPGPAASFSDVTGIPGASQITNMVFMSQEAYDTLETKSPTTLYFTAS